MMISLALPRPVSLPDIGDSALAARCPAGRHARRRTWRGALRAVALTVLAVFDGATVLDLLDGQVGHA